MRRHAILKRFEKICLSLLVGLLVAGLAACGGGSSANGGVAPTPVPAGNLNLVVKASGSTSIELGTLTVDGAGNVYVVQYTRGVASSGQAVNTRGIYSFKPDAPTLSRIGDAYPDAYPNWVAMVTAQDSLYVATSGVQCQFCGSTTPVPELLKVQSVGEPRVLLMGQGTNYEMSIHYDITGIDRDADGNIFFTKAWRYGDPKGEVLKYTSTGVLTSIAILSSGLRDVKVGRDGFLYVASCATDGCGVLKVSADGATSPFGSGKFVKISSLALDGKGNVYVADQDNHTVHKITAQGQVSTIAGVAGKRDGAVGPLPASLSDPRWLSYSSSDNKLYLNSGGAIVSIDLPN